MGENITFRVVKLDQTEAEAIADDKPVTTGTVNQGFTNSEINNIVPPLEVYEAVKGKPYLVDHLELSSIWNLRSENPKVDKTFGNVTKKVGVIEGWLKNYMKKNFISDDSEGTQRTLRMVDKMVNYSTVKDPMEKLNKVYQFIVSSNKNRAFQRLRRALQRRAIDEVINLDYVKPSRMGQYMPRRE